MTAKQFERAQDALGLSDVDLAKRLDVSRITVWRWKNGKKKIAKVVEFAMMWLTSR